MPPLPAPRVFNHLVLGFWVPWELLRLHFYNHRHFRGMGLSPLPVGSF